MFHICTKCLERLNSNKQKNALNVLLETVQICSKLYCCFEVDMKPKKIYAISAQYIPIGMGQVIVTENLIISGNVQYMRFQTNSI